MGTPLQKHQETLRSHITDGETAIDACTSENLTFLVTDRRLLKLTKSGRDDEVTTVDSTFFDTLGGVKVSHTESNGPDEQSLIIGVVALAIGLASFAYLGQVDGGAAAIVALFGLTTLVVGVTSILDAYDTDDGTVSITLRTTEGDEVQKFTFHEDYLEFAETISKTVSETRSPSKTKRKISG